MRIISKFKDYYDGAMGLGMDTSVLFMRQKPETLEEEGLDKRKEVPKAYKSICPNISISSYFTKDFQVSFCPVSIYFCGKVYRGLRVLVKSGSFSTSSTLYDKTFYSLDQFISFMEFHKFNIVDTRGRGLENNLFKRPTVKKDLEKFFQGTYDDRDFVEQRIREKTVIALYSVNPFTYFWDRFTHEVVLNPKLSDYEFYRVHPAPQAYQEIEMYISGVLGEANKEPINISDKDRIYQHGFNERSFRKDPDPSKKRNRTRA
jgi:hypothetical protein